MNVNRPPNCSQRWTSSSEEPILRKDQEPSPSAGGQSSPRPPRCPWLTTGGWLRAKEPLVWLAPSRSRFEGPAQRNLSYSWCTGLWFISEVFVLWLLYLQMWLAICLSFFTIHNLHFDIWPFMKRISIFGSSSGRLRPFKRCSPCLPVCRGGAALGACNIFSGMSFCKQYNLWIGYIRAIITNNIGKKAEQ